jgi:hypothetical protein
VETLRKLRKLPRKNSFHEAVYRVKDADLAPPSLTLLLTKQALKDLRIERRHRLWRRPIQRVRHPDAAGHGDGVSGRDLPRARLFAQWGFSGATRSRLRGVVRDNPK